MDGYLTTAEAAGKLNVTLNLVRKLCCESRFENVVKLHGRWQIPEKSIRHFIPKPKGPKWPTRLTRGQFISNLIKEGILEIPTAKV